MAMMYSAAGVVETGGESAVCPKLRRSFTTVTRLSTAGDLAEHGEV